MIGTSSPDLPKSEKETSGQLVSWEGDSSFGGARKAFARGRTYVCIAARNFPAGVFLMDACSARTTDGNTIPAADASGCLPILCSRPQSVRESPLTVSARDMD